MCIAVTAPNQIWNCDLACGNAFEHSIFIVSVCIMIMNIRMMKMQMEWRKMVDELISSHAVRNDRFTALPTKLYSIQIDSTQFYCDPFFVTIAMSTQALRPQNDKWSKISAWLACSVHYVQTFLSLSPFSFDSQIIRCLLDPLRLEPQIKFFLSCQKSITIYIKRCSEKQTQIRFYHAQLCNIINDEE